MAPVERRAQPVRKITDNKRKVVERFRKSAIQDSRALKEMVSRLEKQIVKEKDPAKKLVLMERLQQFVEAKQRQVNSMREYHRGMLK